MKELYVISHGDEFKEKDEFTKDFERIMNECEGDGYVIELKGDTGYIQSMQRFCGDFEFSPVVQEKINKLCMQYNCHFDDFSSFFEWLIAQDDIDVNKLDNININFDIMGNNDNSQTSYGFIPSEADQIHLKEQIEEDMQQLHMLSVKEYLTEQDDPYLRIWGPGWMTMSASNIHLEMKVLIEDYGAFTGSRVRFTIPYDIVFSWFCLLEAMVSGDRDLQEAKARFNRNFSNAWPERASELGLNDN